MKFSFYIFITILFFISYSKITNKNISDNPKDTIKTPKSSFIEQNCLEQIRGYKDRYGIIFSKLLSRSTLKF